MKKDYNKYIWAFLITVIIFFVAIMTSNYFDSKRIDEIKNIEDSISINILSSETQFDLLRETPCEDLGNSSLSKELDSLGSRLSYLEDTRGADDKEVLRLKLDYSLLEIKDYILMNTMAQKCKLKPSFVLYFYSNNGDCPFCQDAGAVLTTLRNTYPDLRIYSFDYNMDIGAIRTLENIHNVKKEFPAFVIHGKPTYGLKTVGEIDALMPELALAKAAAEAAKKAADQAAAKAIEAAKMASSTASTTLKMGATKTATSTKR